MKRPAQNLIVDTIAFVALVLLATTGILIAYVIPPGTGHTLTVWGLGRHEWGDIHLWVAFAFVGLLVVHMVLHWPWIVHMVRGRSRDTWRTATAVVSLVALMAFAGALLVTPTGDVATPQRGAQPTYEQEAAGQGYGRTAPDGATLDQVAHALGIPVTELASGLGLPPVVGPATPWRRLERRYGITGADVRRVVVEEARVTPARLNR